MLRTVAAVAIPIEQVNLSNQTMMPTLTASSTIIKSDVSDSKAGIAHDISVLNESLATSTATTAITTKGLFAKRPVNLTLNTLQGKEPRTNVTETENAALSSATTTTADAFYGTQTLPTGAAATTHEEHEHLKQLDIGFENVRYSTKVGILRRETKDIIMGLTGYFRAGELSGIVGPSGAGKSTLLNILSGYTAYGYTGDFTINDRTRDLKAFKPNVAFITQDTSLQPYLTVKEAMHFAANLKVGMHMSQSTKKERVRRILKAIGMYENRYTRTDNLSGGQKKRLAVALELVNNPPVLILDEPTSGLDSSTSTQLIILLKKLAMEGRTVICTVHQPSALIFQMFNHLYAMAEGQCIYAGSTDNLVPFLAELDLHCPESYNPADYLMEIATHDYGPQNQKLVSLMENGRNNDYRQSRVTREQQLSALRKVDKMLNAVNLTPVSAPVLSTPVNLIEKQPNKLSPIIELSSCVWDSEGLAANTPKQLVNETVDKRCQKQQQQKLQLVHSGHLCKRENIYATPFYRQLSILLLRTFLILWRDNSLTTLRFIIHLVVGLLIGFLYYGIGNDAGNALNNFRYCFYTIMFIMYCAFSGILIKFPLEFPIVSREHFNRWYSLRAYYVAITLADIPIQLICTSLFIFPTYLMTGQPLEFMRLSLFFLIVFLTALVAQSIGLTVGAGLSLQLGAILGPFFICPFLQFSGFFLQQKDAPIYFKWMFNISFLKYSLDGAMLAIFGYNRERLDCKDLYCHYTRPQYLLKDLDMTHANYEWAVIFMFGLFILLRVIAFYIMSFRLRLFR